MKLKNLIKENFIIGNNLTQNSPSHAFAPIKENSHDEPHVLVINAEDGEHVQEFPSLEAAVAKAKEYVPNFSMKSTEDGMGGYGVSDYGQTVYVEPTRIFQQSRREEEEEHHDDRDITGQDDPNDNVGYEKDPIQPQYENKLPDPSTWGQPKLNENKNMKKDKNLLNERILGFAGIKEIPSIGFASNSPAQKMNEWEVEPDFDEKYGDALKGFEDVDEDDPELAKIDREESTPMEISEDDFTPENFPKEQANKNGEMTEKYLRELNGPVPVAKAGVEGHEFEVYFQNGEIDDIEVVSGDFIPNVAMTRQLLDQGLSLGDAILSSKGRMAVNEERIGKPHDKSIISERAMGMLGMVPLQPIGLASNAPSTFQPKKQIHEVTSDLSRNELYRYLPMVHSSTLMELAENLLESSAGKQWDVIVEDLAEEYMCNAMAKKEITSVLQKTGLI